MAPQADTSRVRGFSKVEEALQAASELAVVFAFGLAFILVAAHA